MLTTVVNTCESWPGSFIIIWLLKQGPLESTLLSLCHCYNRLKMGGLYPGLWLVTGKSPGLISDAQWPQSAAKTKRTMVLLTYKTTEILYLKCSPKYCFDTINSVNHKSQSITYLIRIYLYTRFLSICPCFYLFTHCISTLLCYLPNSLKTF